jgi:hypothetical protein
VAACNCTVARGWLASAVARRPLLARRTDHVDTHPQTTIDHRYHAD